MRREFEYRRNVTVKVTDSTRSENFVAFLQDLVEQTLAGLELHCIVTTWRPRPPRS